MLSFFARAILGFVAVGLTLVLYGSSASAGKPNKPGGGGGGTPGTQTIYYIDGDDLRSVDENGQQAAYIGGALLKYAAVTSLVYGADPALDRWFFTSSPLSENQFEIFAYHPGRDLLVQVTDLAADGRSVLYVNDERPHIRLSNDGQDSFLSFVTFDVATGNDLAIVRANLPISIFDAAVQTNSWTTLSDSDLEVIWQDASDLSVLATSWYCWSPAGNSMVLSVSYNGVAPPYSLINYTATGSNLIASGFQSKFLFPRWSTQSPDRILYRNNGIRMVNANGTGDVSLLANTSKIFYYSCEWSPNATMFATVVATSSGGKFGSTLNSSIAKSTLTGGLTTIVPASTKPRSVQAWCNNLKAPGY